MQPAITRWLGEDRPKQFCTFIGSRSMLEHTVDRAAAVCVHDNILTVITRGQRTYLEATLASRGDCGAGRILEQPAARGTGPAIHRAISFILEQDSQATVIVLPSDHFVFPESEFAHCVDAAFNAAERWEDRIVLLAARPTGPETDYGWIETGPVREPTLPGDLVPGFADTWGFHEKPEPAAARDLYLRGGLWNTMVMVGKASTFSALAWRTVPEMTWAFETLRQVIRAVREGRAPPEHEEYALAHVYSRVPHVDFSRDILQRSVANTLVLPLDGVYWSDWGRPERLQETLDRFGWSQSVSLSVLAGVS